MIYAIDRRPTLRFPALARPAIRPFRLLAAFLLLVIAAMLYGISMTPTYEEERMEAEARYIAARSENIRLKSELRTASLRETQMNSAHDDYGYVYPGEIIYSPVFTEPEH